MRSTSNNSVSVGIWSGDDAAILLLDPLKFDEKLSDLHQLNKNGNIKEIIQLLYDSLPMPDILEAYTYEESIAAMRDLGIFMGILKKNGVEPVAEVPELEYVLLVLMVKTDLPPRDTLLHYTVWNPDGARMRTYTGLPDEKSLIESIKIAMPSLIEAILQLDKLYHSELAGNEFEKSCVLLRQKMEGMVRGIVHAKRNVSPAVFANELRFYYDPIKVDYNKDYIGPGAVEMPMFVFDHLLWSSDCPNGEYNSFKEGYLPYNLPFIRDIYWHFSGKPSLVSCVEQNLIKNPSEENHRAAQSVLDLCTVLKSFRMPHKRLAEDAYVQNDEHHRHKGSGGYSTDILHHILTLQNEKIGSLQTSMASFGYESTKS
jgi:monodechloroaminopyrrolnitrin synthase